MSQEARQRFTRRQQGRQVSDSLQHGFKQPLLSSFALMVAPPSIATSLGISPVFIETGAKTQDQAGIHLVCVVAFAGTEVSMKSRQCTMCMCEANHEVKEN